MVDILEVKELPIFTDHDFLRKIRSALNAWERGYHGAKEPDEILAGSLGEIIHGDVPKWPNKNLMREAESILLKMEHPKIVRAVAVRFRMREPEAFWLCLGLAMGAKVLTEMFTDGLDRVDEAISTN